MVNITYILCSILSYYLHCINIQFVQHSEHSVLYKRDYNDNLDGMVANLWDSFQFMFMSCVLFLGNNPQVKGSPKEEMQL